MMTLQPSWRSYFVFYAAILIFGIGPTINPDAGIGRSLGLVLSIFLLLFVIFRKKTTFYRMTKEAVSREARFAGRSFKKSLPLEGIASLEVRRGVVHRLLGIGHLQFCSRLSGQPDLWWFGIADPFTAQKKIERFLKKSPNGNEG